MKYEHVIDEELRHKLVQFIKCKFASRSEIYEISEDIVNQAYHDMYASKGYKPDKENFGYLSIVALRIAYKHFRRYDTVSKSTIPIDQCLGFIGVDNVINEILHAEETSEILDSLDTLKKIERVIIVQRYYGELKFAEIASRNNLNLNTVLSHHRRSLEKLRSTLTRPMITNRVEPSTNKHYSNNITRLL